MINLCYWWYACSRLATAPVRWLIVNNVQLLVDQQRCNWGQSSRSELTSGGHHHHFSPSWEPPSLQCNNHLVYMPPKTLSEVWIKKNPTFQVQWGLPVLQLQLPGAPNPLPLHAQGLQLPLLRQDQIRPGKSRTSQRSTICPIMLSNMSFFFTTK